MKSLFGRKRKSQFDVKLFIMLLTNFIMNLGFSYIIPFYPVLANKEAGLDFTLIGIIMSANSIGSTSFAYVFGSRIQLWGRKLSFNLSLISQGMVMGLYGSLIYMTHNYWLFVIISFLIRLLQGMSRSVYGVCSYSYLSMFWSDSFAKKFSLMETYAAIGMILGPSLGSVLHNQLGFSIPLYGQGVLFIITSILTMIFIPNDDQVSNNNVRQKSKLPLSKALTHKSTALTFITLVITRATINYFNAFFPNHMFSYGLNQDEAALIISIPQFSYIFTILTLPRLINSVAHDKFLNSLSLLISIVGSLVISPIWQNNSQFWNIWVGLLIIGIGSALNRLPAIPVLVNSIIKMGYKNLDQTALNDMASALFQMNLSVSNLIFPFFGGVVYDSFGGNSSIQQTELKAFQFTMLSLAGLQIIQFFIDCIFNDGFKSWIDLCRKRKKMKEQNINLLDSDNTLVYDSGQNFQIDNTINKNSMKQSI